MCCPAPSADSVLQSVQETHQVYILVSVGQQPRLTAPVSKPVAHVAGLAHVPMSGSVSECAVCDAAKMILFGLTIDSRQANVMFCILS